MPRRVKEKPEDFKKRMQQSGEAKERAKDNMYLTGGQAKLDKNKNNRLDAQDFKILRAEKAKGRGMGLQDEKVKPGKVMKAKRGKSIEELRKIAKAKGLPAPLMKGGLDLPVIKSVKPELKKNPSKTNPNKKRFSSMEEMRKAKGFKPGETPAEFNKRKAMLKRSVEAAKATRLGKIIAPIALAGVGAVQYLKSKMKKEESMRDRKKQPLKMKDKMEKKMGGGMMKKYDRGGMYLSDEKIKKVFPEKNAKRRAIISQLVGGDRVSPMKKDRFEAGQSARRKQMLKDVGKKIAKTTPMGLGIKVTETAKKIRKKMAGRQKKPGPSTSRETLAGDLAGSMGPFLIEKDKKVFVTPKKMGGGMMRRYSKGGGADTGIAGEGRSKRRVIIDKLNRSARDITKNMGTKSAVKKFVNRVKADVRDSSKTRMMGGGMMNKPMGYRSGKSVKVKCKLGRNKPTKMY